MAEQHTAHLIATNPDPVLVEPATILVLCSCGWAEDLGSFPTIRDAIDPHNAHKLAELKLGVVQIQPEGIAL